jgi:hypothetical protein
MATGRASCSRIHRGHDSLSSTCLGRVPRLMSHRCQLGRAMCRGPPTPARDHAHQWPLIRRLENVVSRCTLRLPRCSASLRSTKTPFGRCQPWSFHVDFVAAVQQRQTGHRDGSDEAPFGSVGWVLGPGRNQGALNRSPRRGRITPLGVRVRDRNHNTCGNKPDSVTDSSC